VRRHHGVYRKGLEPGRVLSYSLFICKKQKQIINKTIAIKKEVTEL
jgi:hypothetical protein